MTLSRVFRLAILLAITTAVDAKAAVPRPLLSSREVFEVSLEHTSGYLLTARGRTVVETRAGCGTTHTVQRSLLDVTYKDGQPIRTDFVSETWETSDGRTLRFHIRNTQSGNGTEVHDGAAKLAADGSGEVTFTSRDKPFGLSRGTMFPGMFSRANLAAVQKGGTVENTPVFRAASGMRWLWPLCGQGTCWPIRMRPQRIRMDFSKVQRVGPF